jgi:hypothetical protein
MILHIARSPVDISDKTVGIAHMNTNLGYHSI